MPGIAGIIDKTFNDECERPVKCMTSSMQYEFFYKSGTYCAREMGIYVGWVARENSFAAEQPFVNEREDIALLFSGECFVDSERRSALRQKGHQLGQKVASWPVHLYEEEGDHFFERLNGLFSGLLIDKRQKR